MSDKTHGNVQHFPDDLLDKSPEIMTEAERIALALRIADAHGGNGAAHHKMWVIDQMIRVLTGCPLEKSRVQTDAGGGSYTHDCLGASSAYQAFVADHNEKGAHWDPGIAP